MLPAVLDRSTRSPAPPDSQPPISPMAPQPPPHPRSDAPPRTRVSGALTQLPHELLLGIFGHVDAPSMLALSLTSRELAALMASGDELWRRKVVDRYRNIRRLLPPGSLTPRSTWAALYRALASRHIPGDYVGAHHFLSEERVAQWVSVSHLLSRDEIRLLNRHTMPCRLKFLGSPAKVNRWLRRMPVDERELLLCKGELVLELYQSGAGCVPQRFHMGAKRSKARWRCIKGAVLVDPGE